MSVHASHRACRPFPWGSLDVLARADVAALTEVRRWTRALPRPDAVAGALGDLTGLPGATRLLVREAYRLTDAKTILAPPLALAGVPANGFVQPPDAVGVLLRGGGAAAGPFVLVEAERALATHLVARVLKRPPPAAVHDGSRVAPALAGAFAAVVAASTRRLRGAQPEGGALQVVAAGGATELATRLVALGSGSNASPPVVVAIALTVVVGDEAFAARVLVAVPAVQAGLALEPAAASVWNADTLRALGPLPLSVPVVACELASTVADVAALRSGDVWMLGPPDASDASRAFALHDAGGELRGRVSLAAPSSPVGVRAELGEQGRLVLSDELDPFIRETDMAESDAKTALLNAIGDVPVVVRVEVGEARMLAREWAELGRGDVVTLGKRVGEHVVLRVGGVAVAHGELVTIDGEVGVRIAERLGAEPHVA